MYWLGLDVGTGGSRALLINEAGKLKAAFTAPHQDMLMLRPLWAEQDPNDWWAASQRAIQGVLDAAAAKPDDVKGIGLSGQMHGLTLLDTKHEVIRPALIWCDQRSQAQVDAINERLSSKFVLEATANPVVTGFTLPKFLWVREHEPKQYERIRKVLLPKDYIRFKLTGEFATEVSDASGTSMFDVVHRRWSDTLLSRLAIPGSFLPKVYESAEVTGTVRADVATRLGLQPGTPVIGGGGDQAASAVGNGIVEPGLVSCTLGTSGVVFAHMEQPAYDAPGRVHTFCHAVRDKWHVMGVTQGAGLSLQWFRNQLAPDVDYDVLGREAATSELGADGLFWLPYLMGERTPHLDATARAAFVGLTAKHTRADMVRAILEGVAFSQKDGLDIIEQLGGNVQSIRLSGGGARSPIWRKIFAGVFGRTVVTLESQEGSAFGAAILAMVGTGAFASVPEACRAVIREADCLEPNENEVRQYRELHGTYQALYPALRDTFRTIASRVR
ncbi:MAG TPA: xylulokinase [Bryobacteraceae bacterium]|nr:xylulokinase [Bryobacteraceae bacterium]